LKHSNQKRLAEIREHHQHIDPEKVEALLQEFEAATIEMKAEILRDLKEKKETGELSRMERKSLKKVYRQQLVKRSHLYKIAAAWVITVPLSGLLAAFIYYAIRGYMLP
jgi:PiT family inorganic phosphate transporter